MAKIKYLTQTLRDSLTGRRPVVATRPKNMSLGMFLLAEQVLTPPVTASKDAEGREP